MFTAIYDESEHGGLMDHSQIRVDFSMKDFTGFRRCELHPAKKDQLLERQSFWLTTFVSGGMLTFIGYAIFAIVFLQILSINLPSSASATDILLAVGLSSLGVIFAKAVLPLEQTAILVFRGDRENLEPDWPMNVVWFLLFFVLIFSFGVIGVQVTSMTAQLPLYQLFTVENYVYVRLQADILTAILSGVVHLFLAGSITSVFAGVMTLWVSGYRLRKGVEYSLRRWIFYRIYQFSKIFNVTDKSLESVLEQYCRQCAGHEFHFEDVEGDRLLICSRCYLEKEHPICSGGKDHAT